MPKLGDISNVWNTVRELNVGEIREEAEAPVTVALLGDEDARPTIARALRGRPGRFPAAGSAALVEYELPYRGERPRDLRDATLIIFVIDGARTPSPDLQRAADQLALVPAPAVVVCLDAERLPQTSSGQDLDFGALPVIFSPRTPTDLERRLMPELVAHIATEERVAVARRLPGLREAVTRELIGDGSFSNATYALTSGIPEMIPLLNLPLNAADMLVLTKNQALMVYRIGLAHGAPGDFQAQMREILPVIGGGFVWRQAARQLVGLIPVFGLLPKVAVAYAGTYVTGQAAAIWYSKGEVLSKSALNTLYRQALELGRQRTAELMARREQANGADGTPASEKRGLGRFLPWRKKPSAPEEPPAPKEPPSLTEN